MQPRESFRVEPARADDLPAIATLQADSWRAAYRGILPDAALARPLDDWLGAKWRPEALASHHVLVARGADATAGFAAFGRPGREGAFLDNLHVRPRLKGQGIGAALMAAVAVAAGAGSLRLEVLERNHAAREVYRRWGGQEGRVFDERLLGHDVTALVVRWDDAPALARRLAVGVSA